MRRRVVSLCVCKRVRVPHDVNRFVCVLFCVCAIHIDLGIAFEGGTYLPTPEESPFRCAAVV